MQIKPLYDKTDFVTMQDYLSKCGVKDVDLWLKHKYLDDVNNYTNIDEFCKRLYNALTSKQKIYLLVDSDLDGFMSSSMFYVYCHSIYKDCYINPIFHTGKQHGLDNVVMEEIKQYKPSLLVVLDAGTNDVKQDKELKSLGWDIICADHHEREKINPYCTLVNNQISTKVKNKSLSGTGVSWKVCKAYDTKYGFNYANGLISYVAIANIGDGMSFLTPENETFRYWGIKDIHNNLKPFVSDFNGYLTDNKSFSFGMVTNINSLIRLGTQDDKENLFYALCGKVESKEIIGVCKKLHSKQSRDTKSLLEKDVDIIYDGKIILARVSKSTPLTGLVANKMMGEYNKPIILTQQDGEELKGSVRSPIDLKDILPSNLFNYNLGHQRAFGTSYQISNEKDIIDYIDSLESLPEPTQAVFMSLKTSDVPNYLFGFVDENKAYFGEGIPIPKVHFQKLGIYNKEIQLLGANQRTVKFHRDGIDFIFFNCTNKIKELLHINDLSKKRVTLEFIGELGYNEFRGNKTKQCIIDMSTLDIHDYRIDFI